MGSGTRGELLKASSSHAHIEEEWFLLFFRAIKFTDYIACCYYTENPLYEMIVILPVMCARAHPLSLSLSEMNKSFLKNPKSANIPMKNI